MTDATQSSRLGLWLMTIGTGIYTFIPPVVDILTPTHIFHPDWVGHARFHTMWAIFSASAVGLLALWLLWRGPRAGQVGVHVSGAISSCVLGAFMLAAATMPLYGGALIGLTAALVMVLAGWRLVGRSAPG